MYNKRAGVGFEEIRGYITSVIIFIVMILLFYGCQVNNIKVETTAQQKVSATIEASKLLNLFLEFQDSEGKTSSEILTEIYVSDANPANAFILQKARLNKQIADFFSVTGTRGSIIIENQRTFEIYKSGLIDRARISQSSQATLIMPGAEFITIELELSQ